MVRVSRLGAWSTSEYIGTRSPLLPRLFFDFNCQHLFPGLGRGSHADREGRPGGASGPRGPASRAGSRAARGSARGSSPLTFVPCSSTLSSLGAPTVILQEAVAKSW